MSQIPPVLCPGIPDKLPAAGIEFELAAAGAPPHHRPGRPIDICPLPPASQPAITLYVPPAASSLPHGEMMQCPWRLLLKRAKPKKSWQQLEGQAASHHLTCSPAPDPLCIQPCGHPSHSPHLQHGNKLTCIPPAPGSTCSQPCGQPSPSPHLQHGNILSQNPSLKKNCSKFRLSCLVFI